MGDGMYVYVQWTSATSTHVCVTYLLTHDLQNIFLMEDGNLRLIDNEAALMNTWKLCGFDSVFVPTTQKQEIVRLTNAVVLKMIPAADVPVERINPQVSNLGVSRRGGAYSCIGGQAPAPTIPALATRLSCSA